MMNGASLGNEFSTAVVAFHEAVGQRLGLTAAEHKALGYVQRHGPLTAGELAVAVGLTPGAVTALVDRLEARGCVERTRDEVDRRRTFISALANPNLTPIFDELQRDVAESTQGFTEQEWSTITKYLTVMVDVMRRQTARITDS